jgi:hypothetical protein
MKIVRSHGCCDVRFPREALYTLVYHCGDRILRTASHVLVKLKLKKGGFGRGEEKPLAFISLVSAPKSILPHSNEVLEWEEQV